MSDEFRTAIVGGGLAGSLLARRLAARADDPSDVVLLDDADRRRGSDSPAAIFHPFPGRSMRPYRTRLDEVQSTLVHLERWRAAMDSEAVTPTTMVRPLFEDYLGKRLRNSWEEHRGEYPDWFHGARVPADDLESLAPVPNGIDEALVYRPAYTVDLGAVRDFVFERAREAGALHRRSRVEQLTRSDETWHLDGTGTSAKRVILAPGPGLADWFPGIPVELRGGEILVGEAENAHLLDAVLNAGGHVAPIGDEAVAAGSSWFDGREFDQRTDARAIEDVVDRCERLFPSAAGLQSPRIWRGVRAAFGDHQPLVGPVPDVPNLHVLGAFGSKGLLRIPHHANRLADWLTGRRSSLPELVDTRRMNADTWRPFPRLTDET